MWPNTQFPADLVTFTEEILNGKLYFLCSVNVYLGTTMVSARRYFGISTTTAITCSKLTVQTQEQAVKYVQS